MICRNCEKEISDVSVYCNFCGITVTKPVTVIPHTDDNNKDQAFTHSISMSGIEKRKEPNKARKLITGIILIVATMILLIGHLTEYTFSYTHYQYLKHIEIDVNGNNALLRSVIDNDPLNTKKMINLGVDLEAKNNENDTALLIAVRNNNLEIVMSLLENGAETEVRDLNLNTPLLLAAFNGYAEVCEVLTRSGSKLNAINANSENALAIAVKKGDLKLVNMFIELGIDKNNKDKNKDTPLLLAAKLKQYEVFKLLLDNGASSTDKDENDDTVYHILGQNKDEKSMDLLIKNRKTDLISFRMQNIELTGSGFTSVSSINCVIPNDKMYDFYAQNGVKILFDKDNNKLYEGEITNGRITGYGTTYTTNDHPAIEPNQIIYEGNWKNGIWEGAGKSYWLKSTLEFLKSSIGDDAIAIEFYNEEKNTVFYKTNYVNGYRNGSYTRYFSDGTLNDTGVATEGGNKSNVYDSLPLKLKPSIGMNKAQVEDSSWGKPKDINTTTTAYGTREQWVYENFNYLYFENGILVAIQN